MRALSIRLSAFGPYKAEQEIDFRELGNESIFLITGPTGAGKTTIFDAICFALYGKASGSDRDHDTFRSHFATEDDKTAVSFTFQLKGETYLVYRQPKQQRPKERGEGFREEPALAELYKLENDQKQLIHSKIKDVNETVEEMLGLDYDQFRKMIMIPQGEFRKLIAENSKEREEILQKIFRTYFYQDVTEALKTEAKILKEQLEQMEWKLTQEINKIEWDDPSQLDTSSSASVIETLREKIANDKKKTKEINKKIIKEKETLQVSQEAFYKGKQLADKFSEHAHLESEKKKIDQQKPEMEAKKELLHLGEKANALLPFEKQAKDRREEWQQQLEKVASQKKQLISLQESFQQLTEIYNTQKQLEKQKQEEKGQLAEKKRQLEKLKQYTKIKLNLEAAQKKYLNMDKKVQTMSKDIEERKKIHGQLEEALRTQSQQTKDYYQKEKELLHTQEFDKKSQTLMADFSTLQDLRLNYKNVKNSYLKINQEIIEQRDRIQEMEEMQQTHHAYVLASHLHEGETCPVCGSTSHPAKAEIAASLIPDEANKKQQATLVELEKSASKWQEAYIQAKSKGETKRELVETTAREFELSFEKIDQDTLQRLTLHWKEEKQKKEKEFKEAEEKVKSLEQADTKKQHIIKELDHLNKQFETVKQELEQVKKEELTLEVQLKQLEADLPAEASTIDKWQEHIQETERALEKWFFDWEEQQKKWEQSKQKRNEAQINLVTFEQFATDLARKKEEQEVIFNVKVKEAGFTDVPAFQQAKQKEAQLEKVKSELEQFKQLEQNVYQKLQVLTDQLNNQVAPDLDKLQEAVHTNTEQLEKTSQAYHALQSQVQQHEDLQVRIQKLVKEQKGSERKYYDVAELANLARGDNHLKLSFERYVLSSFLDEILLQANIRMDQLTEHRYQLIRSNQVAKRGAQSGLDLEVMDQHTGQQRSVKTLSGGEGFKAALSLALGMADVVQAHAGGVQLETLFIDEGFGTLDELSLEQAIECLKGLQQSNRVLGIISHVPQLKEEIYAKLQIKPSPQGSHAVFTF